MTRDVRPAGTGDVWPVRETASASWHAAYDAVLGAETIDVIVDEWYAIGDLEAAIEGAADREDVAFLVAEPADGGSMAGCPGFAYAVPWPEDRSVAYLAHLYVHPDGWREGIGTALLSALESALADQFDRLRTAILAVDDGAVAFLESAAFERVATRASPLSADLEEYVYETDL